MALSEDVRGEEALAQVESRRALGPDDGYLLNQKALILSRLRTQNQVYKDQGLTSWNFVRLRYHRTTKNLQN